MPSLIDAVQLADVGGALIKLYEVTVGGTTSYFHPGLNANLSDIQFNGNTYIAFPIEVTGIEFNADGALNRPELIIANISSTFLDEVGIDYNDVVGGKVTIRTTLSQYLGAGSDVEFPKKKYTIDRMSSRTNTAVTYELAAPFDMTGVKIPNRQLLGKYCAWAYRGPGCPWSPNGRYYAADDTSVASAADDVCGKKLSSCKVRFQNDGDNATPLPFGGFPGSRRYT